MAPPLTNDDVLAKLSDRMKDTPEGDAWRVKVFRKKLGGYPFPIHVATLDNATLDQIANAEMWLPVLAGGGPIFELECFHASDVARFAGGGRLRFTVQGEERPVSRDVVRQSNWHGPAAILYPLASEPVAEAGPVFSSPSSLNGGGITMVGGASPRPDFMPGNGWMPPQQSPFAPPQQNMALTNALAEIEAMKRDLSARQQREALDALERKHRMELLELEARFKTQQQAAATPQKNPTELIAGLIAAAAPLVSAMMESQRSAKVEQQRSLDAIQQQNMTLLQKALERPAIDPMVQSMMDRMTKAIEDRPKPGEDMQPILEAFSRMTRMSTNSVAMAADLIARNSGQEEHPAMNIVREVRAAVEAVSEGIKASRIQPPQRAAAPPSAQYAQAPQQALPLAPAPHGPGTNGATGPQQPVPPPTQAGSVLEQIEARIRRREDVASVGDQLLDAIAAAEPSVAEGMYRAGGSIVDLFQQRLGGWVDADPQNSPYIVELARYLTAQAEKRGMLASPDEAGEGADESPMAQA